jgi:tetratricopeptide (TPR) repeat protein
MAECRELRIPENSLDSSLSLRLELIANSDSRILGCKVADLTPPVYKNDGLLLRYRLDENQDLRAIVTHGADGNAQSIEMEIENPLTNVVNPQTTRLMIEETKEELRVGKLNPEERLSKIETLASCYSEIGHHEKALENYKSVLKNKGGPDATILQRMALICSSMGDVERAEKFYREAAAADTSHGSILFNLALLQRNNGKNRNAIESVDEAIKRERHPAYLVLRADLARWAGAEKDCNRILDEAIPAFGAPSALTDWELPWLAFACRLKRDLQRLKEVSEEQYKRSRATGETGEPAGLLPDVRGGRMVAKEF